MSRSQVSSCVSVLAELWPVMERCTVISKREVFYLWPFGLAAWLWGTIFINRVNNEQAQVTVNRTGQTIRTNKVNHCSAVSVSNYSILLQKNNSILIYYNFIPGDSKVSLPSQGILNIIQFSGILILVYLFNVTHIWFS